MSSIKHRRAFTSVGVFAVLAACSVGACNKSDSGDDGAAGGTTSGGSDAGGKGGSAAAGRNSGDAGETATAGGGNGGSAGVGASGNDAGASGAEDAGAPGNGGTGTAGSGGTGGSGTAGHGGTAGSGGSGGGCTANTQTDPNNCSRCGKVCESNECDGGECVPVVVLAPQSESTDVLSGLPHPPVDGSGSVAVFINNGVIYEWEYVNDQVTANADDFRYKVVSTPIPALPPATPPKGTVLQDIGHNNGPDVDAVTAVAFDATYVYQARTAGVTRKKLADTSAPTPVFAFPAGFECSNLAVTASAFYMTNRAATASPAATAAFYTIALSPATATAKPTAIAGLAGRNIVQDNLVVVGNNLVWHEQPDSVAALFTAPVTGGVGSAIQLEANVGNTDSAIANDATHLYWTTAHANGNVRSAAIPPTIASELNVVDLDNAAGDIAVDANYLYVMDSVYEVWRVAKNGSGKEALGTAFLSGADSGGDVKGFSVVGVDAKFVYILMDIGWVARLPNAP